MHYHTDPKATRPAKQRPTAEFTDEPAQRGKHRPIDSFVTLCLAIAMLKRPLIIDEVEKASSFVQVRETPKLEVFEVWKGKISRAIVETSG
jgi:hypothetical protein